MTLKKKLLTAVVAVGAIAMMAETSHAFFGLFRGSHGSHGGWGSQGSHGGWGSRGSWGGGSFGGGGSWGGSHGGWGGSHGGWGGSHGSWGSHGSHGSYGGGGYAVAYPAGGYARRGVVRERYVAARPQGESVIASAPAVKTRLTLHVPTDAKVTLAGVTTRQSGETRQFTTSRLSPGQVWDDYTVVVELERDGQVLREERTLQLTGGQAQELSINFDSTQVAQR